MFDAAIMYSNSAKGLAEHFGIRFDNQSFFAAEANREKLAGATTVVANCSSQAAALAAYKSAERKFEDDSDKSRECPFRLRRLRTSASVSLPAMRSLHGSSGCHWQPSDTR
jgi:hypothetical protein